jgi:hypothetical protein
MLNLFQERSGQLARMAFNCVRDAEINSVLLYTYSKIPLSAGATNLATNMVSALFS